MSADHSLSTTGIGCGRRSSSGSVVVVLLPSEYVEEAVATATSGLAVAHVHAHHVGGGERAADVPLGLDDDDVYLRREHAAQRHGDTQADGEGGGDDLVVGAKVDGHEGQPDDAGGVHGEGDVLGLVEVSRHVARLEGVVRAAEDEQAVVSERRHHPDVGRVADEEHLADGRVGLDWQRGFQHDQGDLQDELQTDEHKRDDHLGPGAHEARLLGADLLLAAGQDAGDAVGLGDQCGVAHGCGEAHQEALQVAGEHGGAGDEGEGADVAQEDADQDDEAEFAAGRLDHGRVAVLHKDQGNEECDQNAQAGEDHGHDGLHVAPLQVHQRQGLAD